MRVEYFYVANLISLCLDEQLNYVELLPNHYCWTIDIYSMLTLP